EFSEGPVRYFNGSIKIDTSDLTGDGFGFRWGMSRGWTNANGYASTNVVGSGWVVWQLPPINVVHAGNRAGAVVLNNVKDLIFTPNGSGYTSDFYNQETLVDNTGTKQFTLTDTSGNSIKLWDFSSTLPANQRGTLASWTDADGNVTTVTSRTSDGKPAEIQRS